MNMATTFDDGAADRADFAAPGGISGTQLVRWHLRLAGLFALLGLAAGLALRLELLTPGLDLVSARTFGVLLSVHGMLLFYFAGLPLIPVVMGYAAATRLEGVRELAFPRLGVAAFALLGTGGALLLAGFIHGGTEAGWMFDAGFDGRFGAPGTGMAATGVLLAAIAMAVMFLNVVVTVLSAGRQGASAQAGLPPFALALLLAGATGLIASGLLACLVACVVTAAVTGFSLFDVTAGGDPELFRTLFRFFGSPARNLLLLAALGAVAGLLIARTAERSGDRAGFRRIFIAVAITGALAWEGTSSPVSAGELTTMFYAVLNGAMCVAVVLAIGRCVGLLRRGLVRFDPPVLYSLGFLLTLVSVLGAGFLLALPATRLALGGTLFATAHSHLLMTAVFGMALLGVVYDLWPGFTGRRPSEGAGRAAAIVIIAGTQLAFAPMFLCGRAGLSFRANAYPPGFQTLHALAAAGATLLIAGLVIAAANLAFAPRVPAADAPARR